MTYLFRTHLPICLFLCACLLLGTRNALAETEADIATTDLFAAPVVPAAPVVAAAPIAAPEPHCG